MSSLVDFVLYTVNGEDFPILPLPGGVRHGGKIVTVGVITFTSNCFTTSHAIRNSPMYI